MSIIDTFEGIQMAINKNLDDYQQDTHFAYASNKLASCFATTEDWLKDSTTIQASTDEEILPNWPHQCVTCAESQ